MPARPTLLLCLILSAGTCQADAPEPSGEEIPNIIVSATRSPQTRAVAPLSIEVITRTEIEASGAAHLADLLRAVSATQVQDNYGDGSRTTIGLRGFGATAGANTLVMIDGRRLNNSDLAPPDLNAVALRDVERVEIIQGSSAVMFGDQAVGGVVNIITQMPGTARIELVSGIASHGGRSLQGLINQPIGDRLSLRATAESKRSDGYRDRNRLELTDLRANLIYRDDDGSNFLEAQRVREQLQLPGALTPAELAHDRTQAQFASDFADTDTTTARLGTERQLSDALSLRGEWTHRQSNASGSLSGGTRFSQRRRSQSLNPRLQCSAASVLLTAGADLERSDYRLRSLFGSFPATTLSEQEIRSEYLQAIWPVEGTVSWSAGLRHAHMRNEIEDSFSGLTKVDTHAQAWELGLNYRPSEALRLYLRSAGSYRFPKTDELTFTGINNRLLDTQTGRSLEGGVAWRGGSVALGAALYRLALEQEIGFDPLADIGFGFFGANNNLDDTERQGLLLTLKWHPNDAVALSARIDRMTARFSAGPFRDREIPFVSERMAHLGATWRPREALTFYLEAQYTGPRYADGDFGNDLSRQGGYTVVNGNVTYRRNAWTLSLRADNVADKRYSEYVALRWDGVKTYYPLPERRYHLNYSYRF